MKRAVVWLAVTALGCARVSGMTPGTVVPVGDLYAHRDTLRALVAQELAAGDDARAFYVLEVEKTRTLGADWLASRSASGERETSAAYHDLRPLFASLVETTQTPESPQRAIGLRPVAPSATPHVSSTTADWDDRYWHDLALYEARLRAKVPYAQAVRGHLAPVSVEEAQLLFGDDEAYVSYFVDGGLVRAFVLWRGHLRVHTLGVGAEPLRQLAGQLLAAVSTPPTGPDDDGWRVPARALGDALLSPIPELADPRLHTVYVSPDAFLGCFPFAVLLESRDGHEQMLLERLHVTLLVSASGYRKVLERNVLEDPPSVLAIGNPTYPAGVPALPMADKEADEVSDLFDTATLLRGDQATEQNVVAAMAENNILHFATHAVIMGNVLAGASSLLLAADADDDGFLSAAEITRLDLRHVYLAVLSACETSVGDNLDDATDLTSLVGAFLGAGARTVMGTLWPVTDEASVDLMRDFYGRFLAEGAGNALRDAQLAMTRSRQYRHPYFWAAFVVAGWDK